MDEPKVLSGDELVAKGVTKLDATLPEIGMKDVLPNGSWLEQKQIQAALEARKHLIEVERIEKCGTLSQAEWQDELMLAEVTQQAGGYWQYLGHHVDKKLYLKPEEALFLMEVNCLLLKHNEVTVSLQKAFSLLLSGTTSLIQYKVYASLSRLGYKVYKHKQIESKLDSTRTSVEIDEKHVEPVCDLQIGDATGKDVIEINDGVDVNQKENKTNTNIDHTYIIDINSKGNDSVNDNEDTVIIMQTEENTTEHIYKIIHDQTDKNIIPVNIDKDFFDEDNNNINSVLEINDTVTKHVNTTILNDSDIGTEVNSQESNNIPPEISQSVSEMYNVDNTLNVEEENTIPENSHIIIQCTVAHKSLSLSEKKNISENSNTEINKGDIVDIPKPSNEEFISVMNSENMDDVSVNNNADIVMEVDNHQSDIDTGELCDSEDNVNSEEKHINAPENVEMTIDEESTSLYSVISSNMQQFSYQMKIDKLQNRKLKPANARNLQKSFDKIPDLSHKHIVTINVPEEQYLPRNIFVNNTAYVLNLEAIKSKSRANANLTSYPSNEINESHILRLGSSPRSDAPQNTPAPLFPQMRFMPPNPQFRPYNFWRPRTNFNYGNFNMFYQRPFLPPYFMPRFQFYPRPNLFGRQFTNSSHFNANYGPSNSQNNSRKRARDGKFYHLQAIKSLSARLKQLVLSGMSQVQNVQSLQRLIHTYNSKYKCRLRLAENFDIIDDTTIVDTIELDDEEASRSKRPRLKEDTFKENLDKIKQLASSLKQLEVKGIAFARHRRAFSNVLKTFNKSFKADVYLNVNYEIIDRKHITLDSDSDSERVVKENQKRKKLRNPFNILKRLSEKHNVGNLSTSKDDEKRAPPGDTVQATENNQLQNPFKNWLPNEEDFGRKEVVPKHLMETRLMDAYRDEFLYEFLNYDPEKYDNWLDGKIAFLKYIEETNKVLQSEHISIQNKLSGNESELSPLIGPEDCTDMPSVLKKLSIISNNKETASETSLCVDFDVYNRDVQNFRKSNRPKPHFRVVCINESSSLPNAADVAALHTRHSDGVAIVFAIIGVSSISYLQINPTDLPVYIPRNDMS